jgi:predicted ribosomally synthesized peptide with nif11-like leader
MAEGPTPDLDPWPAPNDEALLGFLHQAQGDEALQEALSLAPDAAAVAAIARAAGYPISELDLWRASGIPAEELFPPEPDLAPIEAPLARFLLEAEHDAALLEALATAEDAAAVAAIAQAAGYPITTADLWEASDALPEELLISELIVFEVEEELPN